MNTRKTIFLTIIPIVILGGITLGGIPFLIALLLSLITRQHLSSLIISAVIVSALFLLSWTYGGISSSWFQISLHNSYKIGGYNSVAFSYVSSLFFTYFATQLGESINKFHSNVKHTSV